MPKSARLLISVAALTVAASGAGCGGAHMTSYTPLAEKTKYSDDSLYIAARKALPDVGYQPIHTNVEGHSLETREREVSISSVPRLSYKYSFHIETTGGVLSIKADCTQNSATDRIKFEDCGDDRPAHVIEEQEKIRTRILDLAPRAEALNPDWEGPPPEPEEEAKPDAGAGDEEKPGKGEPAKGEPAKGEKGEPVERTDAPSTSDDYVRPEDKKKK